jgi:Short C-terminal domain
MNAPVTPDAEPAIADIAARYGLSREAVLSMLVALQAGGGTMAQFSIPELGGSGQWMRGGMTMVGNMFDNALKARVDGLCNELAQLLSTTTVFPAATPAGGLPSGGKWWPADLGAPSATGGQNDTRYAVFPGARRLAIHAHGVTRVFDTGEHQIGGVQQQQGGPSGTLSFTSQLGTFDITSLREIGAEPHAPAPTASTGRHAAPTGSPAPSPPPAPGPSSDPSTIIAAIESLAGLHERGILSDDEFAAKKTELLGRL